MTLKPGEILKKRYEIIKVAGTGAFGVVYLAYDRDLMSNVAVKEFNPQSAARFGNLAEMQKRFEQEARITRRLKHPHIVEIYDTFPANNTYYIVMPYLPETLADRLEHLTLPQAVEIIAQICKGLACAHTFHYNEDDPRVVVHCDVKPTNILFERDLAKIADFGIAHVPASKDTRNLTATAFGAGTVFYMSPEQLEGTRDDPRIDVYALGTLFYRMLTKGHYYLGFDFSDNPLAQASNMQKISTEAPLLFPLKSVPESLVYIVFKALSKNVTERYDDAGEMLKAIQRYNRKETIKAPIAYLLAKAESLREELKLDSGIGLDFDKSKACTEEILALYNKAPANPKLRNLALDAATHLANLILSYKDDNVEWMWETFRLLYPLQPDDKDSTDIITLKLRKKLAQDWLRPLVKTDISDDQVSALFQRFINQTPDVFSLSFVDFDKILQSKKGTIKQSKSYKLAYIAFAAISLVILLTLSVTHFFPYPPATSTYTTTVVPTSWRYLSTIEFWVNDVPVQNINQHNITGTRQIEIKIRVRDTDGTVIPVDEMWCQFEINHQPQIGQMDSCQTTYYAPQGQNSQLVKITVRGKDNTKIVGIIKYFVHIIILE